MQGLLHMTLFTSYLAGALRMMKKLKEGSSDMLPGKMRNVHVEMAFL